MYNLIEQAHKMKKQYTSPLCTVVTMETGNCILAGSNVADKVNTLDGITTISTDDITSSDEGYWIGAKGDASFWED